ncbi:MAG: hypothetical protein JRI23_06260 [Deltaproteobacteria bacterium]|jgi:hypothetical protein|nr:hypothetical protein [Deltaproteobacteria bacterium]MBW2531177.1 hypothetical protein [Deltaproteobacteria bacterium]
MARYRAVFRGLVALGLAWAAGCNVVLGYEEGQLDSTTPAGVGTAAAVGPGTGTGGTSAGADVGAGGTGGSSAGGSAGSLPSPCEMWGSAACGLGEKCTVVNPSTGDAGCVAAGPRPAWSYCEADTQCQDRTWCDHETSVCKPVCQNSDECPTDAHCQTAGDGLGGTVFGLMICTSHCDPLDATSCNQSFGPTNCVHTGEGAFDCAATGDTPAFEPCLDATDCAPGLGCHGINTVWCRPWCDRADDQCPWPKACLNLAPAIYYDGAEYGMCG